MIELDHVTRKYGSKVAVDDLTLTIGSGELFAFLGPNGAGKTTTIKMMTGLLQPTSGSIRLAGFDVSADHRQAKRSLGYVPDEPYLYEKLTGREFLEFMADMHALDRQHAARKIDAQIENFELAEFVDDLAETYSLGMKQRVAFASALLHEPAVLVVDEPMVGLDPRSVRLVKDLLRNKAAQGMSIFMSTHLLSVAEELAARVGIVDQGRLRFLGTIDQLEQKLETRDASLEDLYLSFTSSDAAAAKLASGAPGGGHPLEERVP